MDFLQCDQGINTLDELDETHLGALSFFHIEYMYYQFKGSLALCLILLFCERYSDKLTFVANMKVTTMKAYPKVFLRVRGFVRAVRENHKNWTESRTKVMIITQWSRPRRVTLATALPLADQVLFTQSSKIRNVH